MGSKVTALAAVGMLVLASAAIAKSYELEGDFGDSHPSSEVTSKVQVRDGVASLVKAFEFTGLIAECANGSEFAVTGESGRPAEIIKRGAKRRFELKLAEGRSVAEVHGRASRSGKSLEGRIEYAGRGGCEAEARFELER